MAGRMKASYDDMTRQTGLARFARWSMAAGTGSPRGPQRGAEPPTVEPVISEAACYGSKSGH
jgi:hypothetical protein